MAQSAIIKYATYPKLQKMALMVVAHKSSSEEIGILRKLFKKYDSRGSILLEQFSEFMSGSGSSEEELRSIYDAVVRIFLSTMLDWCDQSIASAWMPTHSNGRLECNACIGLGG